MLSARMSLGIAQIVFYTPVIPLAILVFIRHWKYRPRMAWWPLVPLTLMRLVAGVITTILEKNEANKANISLIVTAIILLNVGTIPLIVATLGQMRLVLVDDYRENPKLKMTEKLLRLSLVVAVALLAAGGGVSSSDQDLARTLSIVGYVLFAVVLAILIAMELYLFTRRGELLPASRKVLKAALLAAPLLVIRTVYGILEASNQFAETNFWSPLYGNLYAFCFMCLLVEYIAICIYFWAGLTIPLDRGVKTATRDETRDAVKV